MSRLLEAEPVVTYNGLVRLSRRLSELCELMQPLVRDEWQLRESELQLLVQFAEVVRNPRRTGNFASNAGQLLDSIGILLGKPQGADGIKKQTEALAERIFQSMLETTRHFGGSEQFLVAFAVICGPIDELLDVAPSGVPMGLLFDSHFGKLDRDIRRAQAEDHSSGDPL